MEVWERDGKALGEELMVRNFNCSHCRMDTAGNHEWDCPLHPDQIDLEEARRALEEPGPRLTLEQLKKLLGFDSDT